LNVLAPSGIPRQISKIAQRRDHHDAKSLADFVLGRVG
jgi:hypothetical protein